MTDPRKVRDRIAKVLSAKERATEYRAFAEEERKTRMATGTPVL